MNKKFPNALKYGSKLAATVLIVGLVVALTSLAFSHFFTSISSASNPQKSPADSLPNTCQDSFAVNLDLENRFVQQKVHKHCLSKAVFLPDLPLDRIGIDAPPGEINICLWYNNRCVDWIRSKDGDNIGKTKKEIPVYSALRFMGDEGVVKIHILERVQKK
ncbi:MAG: hypothetical protein Q7S73_01555 [bacterium]|nr:hypothetical protein [bacterium]